MMRFYRPILFINLILLVCYIYLRVISTFTALQRFSFKLASLQELADRGLAISKRIY